MPAFELSQMITLCKAEISNSHIVTLLENYHYYYIFLMAFFPGQPG